jgi:hypothetical protein
MGAIYITIYQNYLNFYLSRNYYEAFLVITLEVECNCLCNTTRTLLLFCSVQFYFDNIFEVVRLWYDWANL